MPPVENLDVATARSILQDAGFKVVVQDQDTDDRDLEGVVLGQDPGPGTQAPVGATVTLTVGNYVPPAATTTETTTTTPTTTEPAITTGPAPPPLQP